MGLIRRRIVREAAVLAVVVVAAALWLRGPMFAQGFSIDESRWISTSRYFWITFVERDLFGPDWQPNYIVMTHPPVGRYLIGLGLALQGWTPEQLNGRYDSLQSRAYNERAGNVPDLDLLWAARAVTYLFGVLAVVLLYAVGRSLGGIVAGLVAAALALVNPLLSTVWTRALAESIVTAFTLLTLWLALLAMPRVVTRAGQNWVPLAIGAGLALATATKINGAIGAIGLGLFAAIQQGIALFLTRRTAGLRSWVDLAMVAVVLFTALNPLLWVRPVERAVRLYHHRQEEMQFQRSVFSDQAVPDGIVARISRVSRRAFDTYATPRGPLPLSADGVLVVVGLGVLAWRASRELRDWQPGRALLFLSWLAASYAIITVNLGFDSSHYYVPLVTLNMALIGVAVAAAAHLIGQRLLRRAWPQLGRRLDQKTQVPAT